MAIRVTFTLIIITILVVLVSKEVDWTKVSDLLLDFPKSRLLLILVLSLSVTLLKVFRFFLLLRHSNYSLSYFQSAKIYISGQATSPLPAGEAMRGVLIKQEAKQTDLVDSSGPVVTQMFIELLSAAIVAIVFSFVYRMLRIPALIGLLIIIAIAFVLTNKRLMDFLSNQVERIPWVKKYADSLLEMQAAIRQNIISKHRKRPSQVFLQTLVLGIIGNFLGGVMILLIANAYHIELDIFRSTFVYSASIVIAAVASIIPGGLGVTEGGMTGILLLSSVNLAKALAIVFIFRIMTLVFNTILGGVFITTFYGRVFLKKGAVNEKKSKS